MDRHRAITKSVGRSFEDCELTYLERSPIDLDRAVAQHRAYRAALEQAGLSVEVLPPDHDRPDAVFVEDAAVVLDEVAIVTRPRSETRRRELPALARALERYRPLARIDGDALSGFHHIQVHEAEPFAANSLALGGAVHLSARAERTREILERHGYRTRALTITEFEKAEAGLSCLSLIL